MKILVVGCGRMGMSHGFLSAALIGKNRVIFIDTNFLSRLVIKVLGFKTYKSITEAVKENIFTHAIVTTPTGSHASVMEELCCNNIKKLFVEKPFTANTAESVRVLNAAEEINVDGQVGYVYRFQQNIMEVKAFIDCNIFGQVISYNAQLTGNVVQSKGDRSWRTSELGGGGVVRDFGSHLIDTVNYLFGKSHGIEKIVRKNILSCDTEDYCSWKFRYDNYLGDCIVNWADKSVRKATLVLEIQFEKGKIIASGNGLKIESNIVVEKPLIPSEVQFYIRGEEFSRQMEVFLGVTNVSEWSSPCNFQEAYQVDRIIEELKKSELL